MLIAAGIPPRQLGVIAGARRLHNCGERVREQSGEQHRGFYLRAGHGHFVGDGMQFRSANHQRCELIFARLDFRAHLA